METDLSYGTVPVLTIAIPTWNRASYLDQTLLQLGRELKYVATGFVEVLVSDNCSLDKTSRVVRSHTSTHFPIRYIRNSRNIGSDHNIAQCFNLARGTYVLILGDDDLPVDGTLGMLEGVLRTSYGVVALRPYGFDDDFRLEHPGGVGQKREFESGAAFLEAIGPYMTLISSCIINKRLLKDIDARDFCGGNLVQVHLVARAALRERNLFIDSYQMACKRNNSGGYNFSHVFVTELSRVLDSVRSYGLSENAIRRIETRMILAFYPTYLLRERLQRSGDPVETRARFYARFHNRPLYYLWLAPTLVLPRPLAIGWAAMSTLIGRIVCGDLRRGLSFAIYQATKKLRRSEAQSCFL